MIESGRASDVSDAAAQTDVIPIDRSAIRTAWAELYVENNSLLEDRQEYFDQRDLPTLPSATPAALCGASSAGSDLPCGEPTDAYFVPGGIERSEACVKHVCKTEGCDRSRTSFQHCAEHEGDDNLRQWVRVEMMMDPDLCADVAANWPYHSTDMRLVAGLLREQALDRRLDGMPHPELEFLVEAAECLEEADVRNVAASHIWVAAQTREPSAFGGVRVMSSGGILDESPEDGGLGLMIDEHAMPCTDEELIDAYRIVLDWAEQQGGETMREETLNRIDRATRLSLRIGWENLPVSAFDAGSGE